MCLPEKVTCPLGFSGIAETGRCALKVENNRLGPQRGTIHSDFVLALE
jgi:hypothetical protein